MSFRYKYGDKVWLLPYEEAPDHNWIEKRAWERIRARGIQTVAEVWNQRVRFERGMTWIPVSGITPDEPSVPIEVGDLL